ncbi:caspase domain-containing protein [Pendulispora brunnea]|uniref:caspase family protein n=1 Tax=Pendulispora brunnea TaxID=2905690 RepID=UPI00374E1A96
MRILVAAASTVGLEAERPLRFSTNDAARVRDVLVTLGGVRPEHAFVVNEPSRAQLFASIARAKHEAEKHRADEVTLVFYFSGHGDRDALHLAGERVLLADLSGKLAEVPAGLRLAVTDACRASREKGFTAEEPFTITAVNVAQATGQVWLHASGDGEAAQESDELQGAIFTHAWLNGLRGAADSNGDARVTLEESFAFAHAQTLLRSAKSTGVLQKPEAIVTLRETAPIVLTQPLSHGATLTFPQARDMHFLVYLADAKSVLSEMWSSHERRIAMRVPAGHYVVQRRAGSVSSTAMVALTEGESRDLQERDFATSPRGRIARKGDERGERGHELSAGYESGWNARTGFVHGPQVTYAYAWSFLALSFGGGADFADRTLERTEEHLVSGYGRAGLEIRARMGAFTARFGGGARAGILSQSLEPMAGSWVAAKHDSAFFLGPEVFAAGRIGLGTPWFVDIGATGRVLYFREESQVRGVAGLTASASLGVRF